MSISSISKLLTIIIKVISTILIISVLGIELENIYAKLTQGQLFDVPLPILGFGRFVLVAHFLEGIMAFVYARSRNQAAITSGVYTFFVGTVGLIEIFKLNEKTISFLEKN